MAPDVRPATDEQIAEWSTRKLPTGSAHAAIDSLIARVHQEQARAAKWEHRALATLDRVAELEQFAAEVEHWFAHEEAYYRDQIAVESAATWPSTDAQRAAHRSLIGSLGHSLSRIEGGRRFLALGEAE